MTHTWPSWAATATSWRATGAGAPVLHVPGARCSTGAGDEVVAPTQPAHNRRATRAVRITPGSCLTDEREKSGLVEHGHPEAFRVVGLAAGRLADDDVVGLLRHGADHASSRAQHEIAGGVARERGQGAREHEALA